MDLIKITSDKERARSILRMTELIKERISKQDMEKMSALVIADYYEILKELITPLLLIDGYKTLSHKDLIDYLKERYTEFRSYEISFLDDLRVLRNRISYEGFFVDSSYLERNKKVLEGLLLKLKNLVEKKLER